MAVIRRDPDAMPDGTSRSGLSQGVVTEIVRERADALAEVKRLRHQLAGAVEDAHMLASYVRFLHKDTRVPVNVAEVLNRYPARPPTIRPAKREQ